jgi:hypothetical protein
MTSYPKNLKPQFDTSPKLPAIKSDPQKKKDIKIKLKAVIKKNREIEEQQLQLTKTSAYSLVMDLPSM